jgi:MoxR-like ATPase
MTPPVTPIIPPAPPVGSDPDLDAAWQKVKDALTAAGNPAGVDLSDEGEGRAILAMNMTKHGGKIFAEYVAEPVITREAFLAATEDAPRRRTLVIPKPEGEPVWWDDPEQAEFLDHFILTRRALGNVFEGSLIITGPAGSGKTMGVPHAIDRINAAHGTSIGYLKMDCATITDPQKWFGRREVDANGTRWEKSDFIIAVERGDTILLDEITRLHPHLHNPVMAFLDGSNAVNLSDLNVTVERHPQTVFLATANIGVQFGGTHRMDWAMRERFPFTIERTWPPKEAEVDILTSHTGCDEDGASGLVTIAAKTRQMYESGDLRAPISTRTLVAAAWLVASGMSEREALTLTAVPLYDPDANGLAGAESERQRVRATIEGKFGRGR